MSDRYGVIGHPVEHSKSPFIHARFAEQTGEDLVYAAIHAEPDAFERVVDRFRGDGGRGLNVTLPFKQAAYALASIHTERARRAEAVNTLRFDDGQILGDNTDGEGLIRDLRDNLAVALEGKRVLLLGAGGAARGVLGPLLDTGPSDLVLANRTPAKARRLCEVFAGAGPVRSAEFHELGNSAFDLLINATAASVGGDLPPVPDSAVAPGACVYDLMYAAEETPFVRWGRSAGAGLAVDGLGMLVEQAAESFCLWRGLRPRTAPALEALRQHLGAENGR